VFLLEDFEQREIPFFLVSALLFMLFSKDDLISFLDALFSSFP
jgi:hypothetical protein